MQAADGGGTTVRLLHFSEDPAIAAFEPRPLRVPVDRGPDRGWLNGPLVWATDEAHALPRLSPLKPVWRTTLHASGIRMRNAQGWGSAGWSHSGPGRTVVA